MIKLKLSFGKDTAVQEFEIEAGELLSVAVGRALGEVPLNGRPANEIFNAIVNGNLIDKDFWTITILKSSDSVLITPQIKSGDAGQIFKQVAIIAVTAVASFYLGPEAGATAYAWIGSALSIGAITVGASLLLNALIPPPVQGGVGGAEPTISESQMYSISGQSNSAKRFETVPKVYGRHRIFPTLAAYPYNQLEVDPESQELVQYLYAVYDFGLGPAFVSDIMIGDTPLTAENFKDFQFNFVDFNRPEADEGIWDASLKSDLSLYKGDFDGDTLGVGLDGNSSVGDPQSTWQAIRNSSQNIEGVSQEIILNFINQEGLYGFSSTGIKDIRKIDLDIYFSKIGEDVWRAYNDNTYVSSFSSVGGDSDLFEQYLELYIPTAADYVTAGTTPGNNYMSYYEKMMEERRGLPNGGSSNRILTISYSALKRETNKLIVHDNPNLLVGNPLYLDGTTFIGNILSMTPYFITGVTEITVDRPINESGTILFTWEVRTEGPADTVTSSLMYSRGHYVYTTTSTTGRARIKRADTAPVYSSFRFTPREAGQYKVRVRRISTGGTYTTTIRDKLTWSGITTRFDRSPIRTEKRHVFLEVRIKATSQLNGSISNLSGICHSACEVYDADTETWIRQLTKNPAWVFVDLLTGEVNKKAIVKSRLDLNSIVEWAEFCDAIPDAPPDMNDFLNPRFETNFVLDYKTTLQEVLGQVSNAAQASLNLTDGKYGVLIDKFRSTPVQIFTPRNSKGFSSTRFYGPRPHGVTIKFVSPERAWDVDEIIVYDDGYNIDNATDIQELTSFACTNFEQAWRFGRFMIAQNRLRQETINLVVDFEYLVCARGDFVQITQDVMRVGGTPALVKSLAGNVVTINDALDIDPLLSYGYTFRSKTGNILTSTLTPVSPREFDLDGDLPEVGDLIIVGEVGQIVFDCLVKSIAPNDDMSASLTLVEKADAIYDFESTGEIPDYDPQISRTSNPDFAPPLEILNLTVADFGYECADNNSGYEYFVDLTWDAPPGSIYEFFSVYADSGKGYVEAAQTRSSIYRYQVDSARLGFEHTFKVIAVSASGRRLSLAAVTGVTYTPLEKSTPPSDITKLSSNITNEVLQLSWDAIPDCDVREYLIRYSPTTDGIWEASVPLQKVGAATTSVSVQARTGIYLIKAIDFGGRQSTLAAAAITTIPNLFNLNLIDNISDSPDYLGSKDRVQILGDDSIILEQEIVSDDIEVAKYYEEGIYEYEEILDLGDIYTIRLESLIQAEGYTIADLMSSWDTLDEVGALSSPSYSEWDVTAEYRSSDQLNSIADWDFLSNIETMNEGAEETFTEWRPFIMGDATGRVFQFRLRLNSRKASVSPRVFSALIRASMPDRVLSFQDETATAGDGLTVVYDPAFKGPEPSPNVQVSIDGAESGDYWEFEYKTLEGFKIRIFDKDDNPVERQIDVAVKGFGHKNSSVI